MFVILLLLFFVNSIDYASSLGFKNGSISEVTYCINKERQALLSFKAGLEDDSGSLSSWSSEEVNNDCCDWRGVVCSNQTGHVIELDLGDSNLVIPFKSDLFKGNISPSLLELRELNYLNLSNNDFGYRPIPKFFGSFTKLQYLGLSSCSFCGTIPSQLGNLSNLNHLDLSGNDFGNRPIPEFFASFTKLQYLDLSYSNVSGIIPSELGNLSNLNTLVLIGIDLRSATNWLDVVKSLASLSYLSLAECQLPKVVSPSLSFTNSSTSIETLDLSNTGFTSSMYYWLFSLSNSLAVLHLQNNMLKGPIPESFGNHMPSIESLDLSHNLLEGMIPKSFRNLCNLRVLSLADNNLSGNFSDFVDNLSAECPKATLEELFVDDNKLFGPIPHGIKKFSSLRVLYMIRNELNETLTTNLGTLSKLEVLYLSFNTLSGVVTEAHFSSLSHLTTLSLSYNYQLVFNISSEWVPPFQLVLINLRSCNIGPSFPQWIRTQKGLRYLDISNNRISENVGSFLNLSGNYTYLNLSSNNIGGTISDLSSNDWLDPIIDLSSNNFEGQLPLFPSSTASLYLSKNKFSGSLSFLCQLNEASLFFLDISHNFLTGGIPDCVGKQKYLYVVDLSHNQLSGEIPASVGTIEYLETLYLYNNSFSGELPLFLSNCTDLIFLDVGVNKLSGNVPAWLGGNLSQLYILSLRSNNFFGIIPSELCRLNALQVLDLSMNRLFGTIPPCLNHLTTMVRKGLWTTENSHDVTYVSFDSFINDTDVSYTDRSVMGWQGRELEFGKNLRYLKSIDLSSNNLTGEFPKEITELFELVALNLSRNALHGKVPQQIGRLHSLLSLDLSRNNLSGNIPATLSQLNSLDYLDLSYNNFSGKIPQGTQLQSFNASNYIGNVGLCGPPLPSSCPGDEPSPPTATIVEYKEDYDSEYKKWLYIGMCMGFVTAFWGTCGALLLNRRGRHAFFLFVDRLYDWLYVKIATKLAR